MHLEVLHEADRRRRVIQTITGRRPARRVRMPRQHMPTAIETAYFGDLLEVYEIVRRRVEREVLPNLGTWIRDGKLERGERFDSVGDVMETTFNRLEQEILRGLTPQIIGPRVRARGRQTEQHQNRQLRRQLSAVIGVDIPFRDRTVGPMLEQWTGENVRLIRSIPRRYLDQVEQRVVAGVNEGRRYEQIAEDLLDRFKVTRSSAQLIARDQVGKFYGNLNRARQTELGIEAYIWQTSNDNRVREEHEEREGKTFRWDEPPEDGHPGIPINCRCSADPDLSAIL